MLMHVKFKAAFHRRKNSTKNQTDSDGKWCQCECCSYMTLDSTDYSRCTHDESFSWFTLCVQSDCCYIFNINPLETICYPKELTKQGNWRTPRGIYGQSLRTQAPRKQLTLFSSVVYNHDQTFNTFRHTVPLDYKSHINKGVAGVVL